MEFNKMHMQNSPLLTLHFYTYMCDFLKKYRVSLISSIVIGLLSHMFVFTNKLINDDELLYLFGKGATIGSGRWGLLLISPAFPDVSMPWLWGILSIFLIALSTCLLIRIFSIETKVLQVILSGLTISFPALTSTFSYMFTSIYYAVSFFFSVLAVYLICVPEHHKPVWNMMALILSVVSTGIYQSYISVSASLLVLFLIHELLRPQSDEKKIFKQGLYFVSFLILSLGCYWMFSKLVWMITSIDMNSYSQEAVTFSASTIILGIENAYRYFIKHLFLMEAGLIQTTLSTWIHIFCFMLAGVELVLWGIRTKRLSKLLLMTFLIAVLPLAINSMYIFISPGHIHTLVLYSFFSVYVLFFILIESALLNGTEKNIISACHFLGMDLIILLLSLVILFNVYAANEYYLGLHLRYENFYSFCTSVVAQLQSQPEYTQNTPVAIIGNYSSPDFYKKRFLYSNQIQGFSGSSPNSYSKYDMFRYYIGHELVLVDEEAEQLLSKTPEFAAMPSYPANGYMQMIGDTIVIKLSD